MPTNRRVNVRLEDGEGPSCRRAFAILRGRIADRAAANVIESPESPAIVLAIESGIGADAFRIDGAPGNAGGPVRIAGGDARSLLYGVGKFLRTSRYDTAKGFELSPWRGRSAPDCSLRGMYFACHFHNWYHVASRVELERYVEDLTLWGVNTIAAVFPFVNLAGWRDAEAAAAMERVRQIFQSARGLGLDACLLACPNNLFRDAPAEYRAAPLPDPLHRHGNLGANLCPSVPAGRDYVLATYRELFGQLRDIGLDAICFWPYDEGGCACDRCRPWGAGGFLRISRDVAELARGFFPRLKTILSTWTFDTPPEGEWEGLARSLAADAAAGRSWVDYILADAHEDFPRWPLEHGVPGGLPMVNFPEISMWGNTPWGGYGAHVLPRRFQRLWDQAGRALSGGLPYSEGIFEDMNKAIVSQFYWDRGRSARETLREYAAYEFSSAPRVCDDVLTIIDCLETSATAEFLRLLGAAAPTGGAEAMSPVDPAQARAACELAARVEARLSDSARRSWRWEILRLRTVLDRERFGGGGLESPESEAALRRLIEICHAQLVMTDPLHRAVRPPLKAGSM